MIETIKNLLWRKEQSRPKLESRVVELGDLTSDKWRKSPQNVAAANKLLNDPTFKLMLAVMMQETPMNERVRAWGSSSEDISRSYGEQTGYLHALAKLQAFGVHVPDETELEAEFRDDLK